VEIEIQRRLMKAVAPAPDVPVAPILAAEADGAVIGAPFFIMEFIEGLVPAVSPSYTEAGFFVEATPDQRRRLVANGVRTLAAVHALDWKAAGLEWLIPPGAAPTLARQLDIWDAYARRELGERHHPDIQRAFDVLSRHLPAGSAPSLCWGDPRPGNIIWQDFQCASVTDWEAAAIAPPELDVGWWLMFDRESHEVIDVPRLDGEPTREEQRQLYAEASGRPLGDTHLYELFAAYRYAAIVVRVMNRAVDRGHMPADHTVWLENPAVTGLQQLLDS
jgi:aminoglycoside phosphotransferase (APT) family kinase protein